LSILAQAGANDAARAAFALLGVNTFRLNAFGLNARLLIVIIASVAVGLGSILVFGYTSDQRAIGIARDKLKAHMLAVRLYRDQSHVVIASYGGVLRGTARYLRLTFRPFLFLVIPITFLIVQLDHYLGMTPIRVNTPFLLTARVSGGTALDEISVELPPEIAANAPPVHIAAENDVVWRLVASREGAYEAKIIAGGESAVKTVRVSSQIARVSSERLRDHFWERMFLSGESALPPNGAIESITVDYPESHISVGIGGYSMNWMWLFFILSMIAGFIFKELLGINV
jgi:hypothetical protein